MKSDTTRVIVTVMKNEERGCHHFVASYTPGGGKPRLSVEGDAPEPRDALMRGLEQVGTLIAKEGEEA